MISWTQRQHRHPPALFLSNVIGSWAFHATGDHHYRPIALGLLTVIALATLVQAVTN